MKTSHTEDLKALINSAAASLHARITLSPENNGENFDFRMSGVDRDSPLSALALLPNFEVLYQRTEKIHFSGSFTNFYVAKLADDAVAAIRIEAEGYRGDAHDAHGTVSVHALSPGQQIDDLATKLVQDNLRKMLKSVLPEFSDIVRDYTHYLDEDDIKALVGEQISRSVFEKVFEADGPRL